MKLMYFVINIVFYTCIKNQQDPLVNYLVILVLTGECFHEIIAGLALFFDSDKKVLLFFVFTHHVWNYTMQIPIIIVMLR